MNEESARLQYTVRGPLLVLISRLFSQDHGCGRDVSVSGVTVEIRSDLGSSAWDIW